jgi:hypothetical protein
MNLGYNGEKKALWDKYDPKLSTYFVPTPVISAIGGGYVLPTTDETTTWLTHLQTDRRSNQDGAGVLGQP